MLHPLLESDKLECIHKGKVLLQSSISNLLSINNAGAITLQDLSQANIIGCQNQILGVPAPCTKLIISTPESITSTLLEVNKEKIVLVESITQVLTDKGSPLSLQESPKAKGLCEIEQTLDSNNPNNTSAESSTAINATNTNNTKDSNMQDNIASQETHTAKENEAMMILEIIRKWEYRNKQSNDNIYDTTKPTVSKFTLRKNSEVLKGYIIEPNGPDSIKSGQHKRIPIGKYKAKWHLSSLKLDNGSYRARRVDLPTQQTNKFSKIVLCCDSRCKHKAKRHSHIIPLLYNENVPEWRGILIHIGSKRTDTDGCLLPGFELNDSDNPTEFQAGSTTNATAELLMQIIMHDEVSYQKQIEIPNFEIVIKEEYNNE